MPAQTPYKATGYLEYYEGELGFVTPVFSRDGKFYIEVCEFERISRFEELPQDYHEGIRTRKVLRRYEATVDGPACLAINLRKGILFGDKTGLAVTLSKKYKTRIDAEIPSHHQGRIWDFLRWEAPESKRSRREKDREFARRMYSKKALNWFRALSITRRVVSIVHVLAWIVFLTQHWGFSFFIPAILILLSPIVYIGTDLAVLSSIIPGVRFRLPKPYTSAWIPTLRLAGIISLCSLVIYTALDLYSTTQLHRELVTLQTQRLAGIRNFTVWQYDTAIRGNKHLIDDLYKRQMEELAGAHPSMVGAGRISAELQFQIDYLKTKNDSLAKDKQDAAARLASFNTAMASPRFQNEFSTISSLKAIDRPGVLRQDNLYRTLEEAIAWLLLLSIITMIILWYFRSKQPPLLPGSRKIFESRID